MHAKNETEFKRKCNKSENMFVGKNNVDARMLSQKY